MNDLVKDVTVFTRVIVMWIKEFVSGVESQGISPEIAECLNIATSVILQITSN